MFYILARFTLANERYFIVLIGRLGSEAPMTPIRTFLFKKLMTVIFKNKKDIPEYVDLGYLETDLMEAALQSLPNKHVIVDITPLKKEFVGKMDYPSTYFILNSFNRNEFEFTYVGIV